MSFKRIDPMFKLELLQDLWGGSSYSQLSNKHNIPRATIYKWEQTAKEAIINAFQEKTPGKRTIDIKNEIQVLKEQLRIMYHDKHKTAQSASESMISEKAPVICQKCGDSHIKKNGTVLTKKDGLRQRYTCLECSFSIYVDLKKTLHQSK